MFHIPASWQTRDAKNKRLLELEGDLAQEDSFAMNCHCRYQDIIKFLIEIFKRYQFPHGEYSHHLLGNNIKNSWVNMKYNGVFTKLLPDCDFNQEICWLIPLPTSTRPTQRISNFFLYGGLLYDIIFCMWWWYWTIELFYVLGPQTSSWFLSLTMQPRHCEYCAGRTYWCPHMHLP